MNFKSDVRYDPLFAKISVRRPLNFFGTLLLTTALLLSGCQPSELGTADELNIYIAEPANNLIHQTEQKGYNISVSYRPADLLIHQELGDFPTEYTRLSTLQKKYSGYYCFILRISPAGKTGSQDAVSFSDIVQVLSQRMGEYVFLTTSNQDTIPVGEYMPSRTFGLSKGTDVLIIFNKEKFKNNDLLKFNLNEFGLGIGAQQFIFRVEDLEQVPHLKFAVVS